MSLTPPSFWQFYARGVMWTALALFPLMMLYDYLNSLEVVVPLIEPAMQSIFSIGFMVISIICGMSGICFLEGMTGAQQLFFAYFVSVVVFAFAVALYLAWTWSPKLPRRHRTHSEDDSFDY